MLAVASRENCAILLAEANHLLLMAWLVGTFGYALFFAFVALPPDKVALRLSAICLSIMAQFNSQRYRYASAQFTEPVITSFSTAELPLVLTDSAVLEARAGKSAPPKLFGKAPREQKRG